MKYIPIFLFFFLFGIFISNRFDKTNDTLYTEKVLIVPGEVKTELETEFIPIEINEEGNWIDPKTIPNTRPWTVSGSDVRTHLLEDHGITDEQIKGWSVTDMHKLHSYLHNGGKV